MKGNLFVLVKVDIHNTLQIFISCITIIKL